jgi:hypothetical protein
MSTKALGDAQAALARMNNWDNSNSNVWRLPMAQVAGATEPAPPSPQAKTRRDPRPAPRAF